MHTSPSNSLTRLNQVNLPVRFDNGNVKGAGLSSTIHCSGNTVLHGSLSFSKSSLLGYVIIGVAGASNAGVDVNVHGIIGLIIQNSNKGARE